MTITRALAIAIIAASSGLGVAQAQSISSVQAPAEFPPASYQGRQYVDSNGCVFVRAGIDGNVSWVPRVSRNRKVICGFQPSLPAGTGTAIAKPPKQAVEPVQITVAQPDAEPLQPAAQPAPVKPAVKPAKAKPKPAQKPVLVAQPQPQPVQQPVVYVPQPASASAKPTVVRVKPQSAAKKTKTITIATAKPAPQPNTMAPRQSACRGASELSQKYLVSTQGLPVRCGPQADITVVLVNRETAGASATATQPTYTQAVPLKRAAPAKTTVVKVPTPDTRFVRENIYKNQVASTKGVYIPKGYKPAWDDDRLNPKRAHQTFRGKAEMELIWTNTVPRRLVDAKSGRVVTSLFPGLQYPNTSYEQQMIAGVSAKAPKAAAATTQRRSSALQTRESIQTKPAKQAKSNRTATISTRATQRQTQTQAKATVSHRYVQAGMFGDMGNAQRAAQRIANAGLPAKLGKRTRNGKVYGVVVAGPFASQGQLNNALQRVRSLGFSDAFLRK